MLIDQSPSAELSPPKSPVTFRNGRPDGSPPDPIDLDIAVVPAGELIIPPDDAQLPPMEHRRPVARMFSDGLVYYEAAPSIPDNAIPDMAEAEDIINKLIQFFERGQGMNILSTTERSSLHTIKCALFQAASGLPYTREQR
jgi:hypothetical protein